MSLTKIAPKLHRKFCTLLKILPVAGKINKPANIKICRLYRLFETFCVFLQTLKSVPQTFFVDQEELLSNLKDDIDKLTA